jgi:hypothetical protein
VNKKPAPPPPTQPPERKQGTLERKTPAEKPQVFDKPHVSSDRHSSGPPERPAVAPPMPPKLENKTEPQPISRPRVLSDRPALPPPEKPKSASYDSMQLGANTLPYGTKPDLPPPPHSPNVQTAKPEVPPSPGAHNVHGAKPELPPSPNLNKNVNKPPRPSSKPQYTKFGSKGSEKDFPFIKELSEQQQQLQDEALVPEANCDVPSTPKSPDDVTQL